MIQSIKLLTLSVALLSSFAFAEEAVEKVDAIELSPTKAQSVTTIDIVKKLAQRHYRNLDLNDSLSIDFLDNYITSLDPAKLYFLQSDIDGFYKNKKQHDNYIKKGDLTPGFEIYRIYQRRFIDRLEWVLAKLQDSKTTFSFTDKEYVEIDRENSPWPNSQPDLNSLWGKRLKLSILNLKMSDSTVKEAKETLISRYTNQINRMSQQNSQDVYETLINAFTVLYDPHTNYFSPRTSENFNINMSLQLEGIGAVLQSEDEHTKVIRLVAGGPADKQGELKASDKIIGVGQGITGKIVDVVGWRLDEVVALIRGKKESIVNLKVLSGEADSTIIQIKRGTVNLEDQAAQKAVLEVSDGNKIRKIGIIDIPAFYHDFEAYRRGDPNFRSTTRDVARLLKELQSDNIEGVILDLRNNGGGSLQEATMLTDLFIDQGPVVQIRESNGRVSQHNRSRSRALFRGPLVIMINRLSASASEIFAGAIQDYNRGLIIGSDSFGKGTVQLLSGLPEGQLKLTESKFYRVSGDSTQHRGVIPDIQMPVIIDHDEVGESTYDTALPWDQIQPAKHGTYLDFTNIVPDLTKRHKHRVTIDPDLIHILDLRKLADKNKNRKQISLNEKERIGEKTQFETDQMEIDNKRRDAKGLKKFANLDEYQSFEDDEKEARDEEAAQPKSAIDLESDTLLTEAGNIIVDMIDALHSPSQKRVANFQ